MRKMFFLILFTVHISCVTQLKTQEIELLLKKDLTSVSERNVEYLIDNIPKKYWKTNDKELVKKKLENLLKDNETKVYGEIDDIYISNPSSCNSFKFY